MTSPCRLLGGLCIIGLLAACGERTTGPVDEVDGPAFAATAAPALDEAYMTARLDAINGRLAAAGAGYAVAKAELSLAESANPASPIVVFASDHALRLPVQWVAGDPRRGATGPEITWGNFTPLTVANGAGPVEPSLDAAFATWNGVTCSNLELVKVSLSPFNFPSAILVAGAPFTNDPLEADISTLGFLPGAIFDTFLGPGASESVLGVTFTLVWIDGNGDPTDVDHNHLADTALKEIWYNNDFAWSTGGGGVDVETVALHEEGHALELGHFGNISVNFKTGRLIVGPRAVMNAFILGTLRSPLGTDTGAYCGYWSSWPN